MSGATLGCDETIAVRQIAAGSETEGPTGRSTTRIGASPLTMLSRRGAKLEHRGPVRCLDASDSTLATGSGTDIYLWDDKNANFAIIPHAHRNAVLGLRFLSPTRIATASADKSTAVWDTETGKCVFRGSHDGIVNGVCKFGEQWLACSDDGQTRLWDARTKETAATISQKWSVVAVAATETAFYTGGVSDAIEAWDPRTQASVLQLTGHTDIVTGLAASDGELLSRSLDDQVLLWNTRSATANSRLTRSFDGAQTARSTGAPLQVALGDTHEVLAGTHDGRVLSWTEGTLSELHHRHKGDVFEVIRWKGGVYSAGADGSVLRQ